MLILVKYYQSFSFKFNFRKKILKTFLFISLICFSQTISAQNISGNVLYHDKVVNDAIVINVNTDQKTLTSTNGYFEIQGKIDDRIKIVKEGFEILQFKIKDYQPHQYFLQRLITEIEEVKVAYKPTGDLKKDSDHYGASVKERRLNTGIRHYFKMPSALSVLSPKPGEFVQPVGTGFSFGEINSLWTLTDFVIWLREALSDEYFSEFGLSPNNVDRFLYYSLPTYDKKELKAILKYGYCSNNNIAKIKLHFEKTILTFNKGN